MKRLVLAALALFATNSFALSLWPTIPFIKGADLCQYQDAYGRSRSEMAQEMAQMAAMFMQSGATGKEALDLLVGIDELIDKNRRMAVQGYGLDVTLESTLKSYIDGFYQNLRPRERKISFTNANALVDIIAAVRNGQRIGYIDNNLLSKLSGFAYGTYAYAPNCRGDILVTIHIILQSGEQISFHAQGKPQYVMSQIGSKMFEQFQRTQFPSRVRLGSRSLELVGAPGAPVDSAPSPQLAEQSCEMVDARLPTQSEYEYLSMLGDWNGGVGLGNKRWALANGYILAPDLRNPTPVRRPWEVNDRSFMYYCVR